MSSLLVWTSFQSQSFIGMTDTSPSLRSDGDDFQLRFAIRADALESYIPQSLDQLAKNSLISMNGSYRTASRKREPVGYPCHRNESLRFLCGCYCDVDFYKHGLTFAQVNWEIHSLFESGALPRASIMVDTGRGLWLIWLLHDESDPAKAHLGAYADNEFNHLQLYSRINRSIGQQLAFLGEIDGARYIRVPGSLSAPTTSDIFIGSAESC
jgi:hypothetical protein